MPHLSKQTWRVLGTVLVALLAVGLWWLETGSGSGGVGPPGPPDRPVASAPAVDGTRTPQAPDVDPDSGLPYVDLAELPVEADETVELIDAGGPFPYPDKDGSTFGNYEGLLPDHERGYYAEYTVPTPGSYDRGARRIIAGEAGELYWTEDHYESFERIAR